MVSLFPVINTLQEALVEVHLVLRALAYSVQHHQYNLPAAVLLVERDFIVKMTLTIIA